MGKKYCNNDRAKFRSLGAIWAAIFAFSIGAMISLMFALFGNGEFAFFEERQWQNENQIALGRGYIVAIFTVILTLLGSSYGFWKECFDTSTAGDVFHALIAACGTACFFSFILFFSFQIFEKGFRDGAGAMFFFALCCLILSILYTIVNMKTFGSTSRNLLDALV
eukprot:CAMPEP_0203735158 /NCGR_PEP_ID=MMETSP0092-20131115/31793_1 /ASSEMBLY_ACC=CAM_ASM_001090 /TAXON_ID=426623 /ORGANISM="Chaetoceros affinis, Strain CCMP159" /LENGTH=165 /DNA_ID=CAMNT_0050619637 /DNA_START=22 /DNA_END=519 /DNA_ORIENTATION=+